MSKHLSTSRHAASGLVASFAAVALGLTGLVALATSAAAGEHAPEMPNVTYCHATPPATAAQGWNSNTTDPNSIIKQGHQDHGADILPAFTWYEKIGSGKDATWEARQFPGLNMSTLFGWGATGAQVLANGCVLPDEPEETPVQVAVTPPVYTAPTCAAAGTLQYADGTGYTWAASGADGAKTLIATAASGYELTGPTEFGPYNLVQLSGAQCVSGTPVVPEAPVVPQAPVVQADTLAETGFPLLGVLGLAGSFSLIGGGLVNARRLLRKSA